MERRHSLPEDALACMTANEPHRSYLAFHTGGFSRSESMGIFTVGNYAD
jgi:hypothetical protein